ncbi:alpha/beta hydrolase [Gammaproteobacteria bacterium]|nr:alpha/beta hydrolase [Gammaproteobacteria bacterium]
MRFYNYFFVSLFFINSLCAFEEGYVYNDDIKIAYRDYGPKNAEPILLVMGLGGQLINWPDHIIDFLIENNYRPIVFDNRDSGLSSRINNDLFSDENRNKTISTTFVRYFLRLPINAPYSPDDMSEDSILILDKLKIDKVHLLGMSMGGMIAQIVAANYPERIKTLTLIASSVSTPGPLNGPRRDVRKLLMQRTNNPNASMDERISRTKEIFKLIGLENNDLETKEFYEQSVESINRAGPDDSGFSRQLMAILASKNIIKKIKSIKTKTLIIHGEDDPLIRVDNAYKANKLIEKSDLLIFPEMRHLIEEPVFDLFKNDLLVHLEEA